MGDGYRKGGHMLLSPENNQQKHVSPGIATNLRFYRRYGIPL